MQGIILCGGLSTRLGDITKVTPKILLPIGNQTILDYQLNLLKLVDTTEVILASGHLHEVLFQAVGHQRLGVTISYAKEEKRLGTGGAIKNAMQYISAEPFFVLNGDILVENLNLARMLSHQKKIEHNLNSTIDGLLLSTLVDDVRDFGEIISDQNSKILAF
ncbi:MAG: nucleotidyltransferase family protein [Candidatus Poribacteria bacterium]|nr:nucleotidyltransferase family protein [Candidatus Poribacteria bacterium]